MAAFEFGNTVGRVRNEEPEAVQAAQAVVDQRRLREECIIALKVYDQCRQPHCKQLHNF